MEIQHLKNKNKLMVDKYMSLVKEYSEYRATNSKMLQHINNVHESSINHIQRLNDAMSNKANDGLMKKIFQELHIQNLLLLQHADANTMKQMSQVYEMNSHELKTVQTNELKRLTGELSKYKQMSDNSKLSFDDIEHIDLDDTVMMNTHKDAVDSTFLNKTSFLDNTLTDAKPIVSNDDKLQEWEDDLSKREEELKAKQLTMIESLKRDNLIKNYNEEITKLRTEVEDLKLQLKRYELDGKSMKRSESTSSHISVSSDMSFNTKFTDKFKVETNIYWYQCQIKSIRYCKEITKSKDYKKYSFAIAKKNRIQLIEINPLDIYSIKKQDTRLDRHIQQQVVDFYAQTSYSIVVTKTKDINRCVVQVFTIDKKEHTVAYTCTYKYMYSIHVHSKNTFTYIHDSNSICKVHINNSKVHSDIIYKCYSIVCMYSIDDRLYVCTVDRYNVYTIVCIDVFTSKYTKYTIDVCIKYLSVCSNYIVCIDDTYMYLYTHTMSLIDRCKLYSTAVYVSRCIVGTGAMYFTTLHVDDSICIYLYDGSKLRVVSVKNKFWNNRRINGIENAEMKIIVYGECDVNDKKYDVNTVAFISLDK